MAMTTLNWVLKAARLLSLGTMMFLCHEVIGISDSINSTALGESSRTVISTVLSTSNPIISTVNAMEPDEASDASLSIPEKTFVKVERHIDKKLKKELQCIAQANYYEAGGEGKTGMMAVTQVVLNRMKESGFPSTACGVINQRVASNCQFSWACSKSRQKIDTTSTQWETAYKVAEDMMVGGITMRGMESALFFHNIHERPNWRGVKKVGRVGSHVFYTRVPI